MTDDADKILRFPRRRRLPAVRQPSAAELLHGIATDLFALARGRDASALLGIVNRIEAAAERLTVPVADPGELVGDKILSQLSMFVLATGFGLELYPTSTGWKACCPFHSEETPSLHIKDTDNTYRCLSCGEAGGMAEFVEAMTARNAVEHSGLVHMLELLSEPDGDAPSQTEA